MNVLKDWKDGLMFYQLEEGGRVIYMRIEGKNLHGLHNRVHAHPATAQTQTGHDKEHSGHSGHSGHSVRSGCVGR